MIMFLALVGAGCFGGGDESAAPAAAASCTDPDGSGGDTGDIPSLGGSWTSSFGQDFYMDACDVDDFDLDEHDDWIGTFFVEGREPDALVMAFGTEQSPVTSRFWGAVDRHGGVSFAGQHDHISGGVIFAQFGGLAYRDQYVDKVVIDGNGFLGFDGDNNGSIDCYARGSWKAFQSGN